MFKLKYRPKEHRVNSTKSAWTASYFPSIEKKYGLLIAHWLELVKAQENIEQMVRVNRLKT